MKIYDKMKEWEENATKLHEVIAMLEKELNIQTSAQPFEEINFIHIPVTRLDLNQDGVKVFNIIYKAFLNCPIISRISRTKSGGISIPYNKDKEEMWDCVKDYTKKGAFKGVEITYCTRSKQFRLQVSTKPMVEITGRKAMNVFRTVAKKFNIDLDSYAETDMEVAKAIKEEIPNPDISLNIEPQSSIDEGITNAHHVDFHSSYPAGLANTHPELRPVIEFLYTHRKQRLAGKDKYYKIVMDASIGFMQSKYSSYKFTQFAKDAITDNKRRIAKLAKELVCNGRTILAFNTDGIWYSGDIYHNPDTGEGNKLGQWENDHVNCIIRFKSSGCYEYIENGVYHPVVRGRTMLERVKPRDKWEWGDIYQENCIAIKFMWQENEGIIEVVE